jgi:hypothetical protein
MSTNYSYAPRHTWTPEEIAQVWEAFGDADTPEALDLFAPDDWEDLYENMTDEELGSERDKLREKAGRWRAGTEMGFSPEDISLFGARTNWLACEEDRA